MEDIAEDLNVNSTDQPPGIGVGLNLTDIEILRDRIEQQKANKLKAEQLVSTLSKIKAREKASRRSIKPTEKKVEDGVSNQTTKRSGTNSSSALKEKSNLLKKKLEEDRAKLESKKGQDDLGKVSQIVEHIRVQLEDQDKTIQQMQNSFVTIKSQPVEELKSPEPDIPPQVKQRIADLEMKIIDLQENLREKDSVISARTQAITLLSEDMARKGKNTLDTLEETRTQMKTMQANFIALEDRMNEERVRLKEELESKKLRLQQVEKNYRTAESARFELSTRIAEFQEKVVAFQSKNIALEEEVSVSGAKLKELQEALDNSNKRTLKMKAQFKAKLKALEEERDMLRKEERTNDELIRLQERIAELEDEKEAGNLLKERIAEMEEKLQRQEYDLDSHIKAITSLETEKLDLVEDLSKRNVLLKEKDEVLQRLMTQIKELEKTKISSEIKCVELEEKLNHFSKTENDIAFLHSELEKAKQKLVENQDVINELSMKLENQGNLIGDINNGIIGLEDSNYPKTVQEMSSNVTEWQARYSALEETLSNTLAHCKVLEDKKKAIEDENNHLVIECSNLKCVVDKLESVLHAQNNSKDEESVYLKQNIAQRDIEICNLKQHNKSLESEIDNLKHSLESTTVELHRLSQQLEEFYSVQQKMEELSTIIDNKNSELHETTNELEKRTRKLSEYKKFHKLKSEDVIRISHELETVTLSCQQKINELETALSDSQRTEEELRKEIMELKDVPGKPRDEVQDPKFQEQSQKIKKLAANVKLKSKLIKDFEVKVLEIENLLKGIGTGQENEKPSQTGDNYSDRNSVDSLEEKLNFIQTEINSLIECLKLREQQLETFKNPSTDCETFTKIKELDDENKKLNFILETKSEQLKKMEEEISGLNGLNKSLLSQLEQLQETYKQDSLKNQSVLDSFEHEMLGNTKDILDLGAQLKEVTAKYEHTWAKLQEKEGYIEELEKQLEKVKSRLGHIESAVEERRRSLETRTEILGARLCEAEKNNEQLEKHEGELEKKINYLLDTEEMMGNIIQKLQQENAEMSKSVKESEEKNLHLYKSLENECNKVQHLTKEIGDLQIALANYEKVAEDYEILKTQLKDTQCNFEAQKKYLESHLEETEHCLDAEIQRLLAKVAQLEAERQDFKDKFNSLLIEKQKLEEELGQLQETIADVTKEEIEQLKISHKQLADEFDKELEKRQAQIYRIQELEIELANQKNNTESFNKHHNEEILLLKNELDKELKEKETLRYELLKEKAKKHVDDVVLKAEETYFNMTNKHEVEDLKPIVVCQELSNSLSSANSLTKNVDLSQTNHDEINFLRLQLSTLDSENQTLKLRLQELESHSQNIQENVNVSESDDWTAITKDGDEGWGWGSKDAMLEQEHLQKQQIHTDLKAKVLDYEQKFCTMGEENTKLSEDVKALQTKCNKLIKKVKEYKNKSESLERSSREKSVGFDDLDIAMQEELRSQVEKLEKCLKECNTNLNSMQSEREGFLKRIDTLTSANEILIEMKERQDIEVEMWQMRSNELQNKVQGLEWTIEELHAEQNECKSIQKSDLFAEEERQQFLKSALETEEKINILAAENDYLQSLIVELKDKDKKAIAKTPEMKEEVRQDAVDINNHLYLKQENDRLNCLIKTLEEEKNINVNLAGYSHEIEELKHKNEMLSTEIENLKCHETTGVRSNKEFLVMCEKYNAILSENEHLNSTISRLNEELVMLKDIRDSIKGISKIPTIDQNAKDKELSNVNNICSLVVDKVEHDSSQVSNNNETPVYFRGFTSAASDSLFDVSIGVSESLISHADERLSNESHVLSSDTELFREVDLALGSEECIKHKDDELANRSSIFGDEFPEISKEQIEIRELKNKLSEKDFEMSYLKTSIKRFEEESNNLKKQIDTKQLQTPIAWSYFPSSESDKSSLWGNKLIVLNEQEKDSIIDGLNEKLECKSSTKFDHSFGDLFSQEENSQESQVNYFVEQITQLTKTLHDKEVAIEQLNDKKEKYKEMYHSLVKDYDLQSPHPSNSDKKQLTCENIMYNQLLEDKETELEMMSQQIEQTIVAKENLQDELSLKLCEMEAVNNAYATPKSHNDMLLSHSQPENIEDVRTLCAEISELTKLLQEKESEVEILKQQLDETNLEKENLIDEWKKTIEEYKLKYDSANGKAEQLEKELEIFKASDILGAEKVYKEELDLKEQQIMNLMNDLSNTTGLFQDLQAKLSVVENNFKICQKQNETLITDLNDLKRSQDSLLDITQDIEGGSQLTPVEKVKLLKSNLENTRVRLTEAELDIEEKENTLSSLNEKIKLVELSNDLNETPQLEPHISSMAMKTFASAPFRISTEQSSSDDDSSSRQMETSQGQMLLLKEIQSLKQVLSMKDSEITKMSIALNEARENLIRVEMRSEEASLRQRLDEALYTLHLRDVRCDELELELMQLLEERDSLQLRLSTAIRFNEELREKSKLLDEVELSLEDKDKALRDSEGNSHQLKQKLDQLHNVGYRRDPTMQQDQQKRYQEQMHLYTHNSSEDEPQTSSGFFNWIFGASSPGSQDV